MENGRGGACRIGGDAPLTEKTIRARNAHGQATKQTGVLLICQVQGAWGGDVGARATTDRCRGARQSKTHSRKERLDMVQVLTAW